MLPTNAAGDDRVFCSDGVLTVDVSCRGGCANRLTKRLKAGVLVIERLNSFFHNWFVFSLRQQRHQPGQESLGRTGLQENAAGAGQVNDQPFTTQQR